MSEKAPSSSWAGRRVHFVGIGGSGMSGIAKIALARGANVTGSDLHESGLIDNLKVLGARIFLGHDEIGRAHV